MLLQTPPRTSSPTEQCPVLKYQQSGRHEAQGRGAHVLAAVGSPVVTVDNIVSTLRVSM